MANASQLQLNPYALFDPSQYTNPYSNYQSSALPAASYAGWPTDAMGNPIQPQLGMTINQTPAQPAAAPAAAATPNISRYAQAPPMGGGPQQSYINPMAGITGYGPQQQLAGAPINNPIGGQPAAAAAPPAAAPGPAQPLTVGSPLTAQQYMQLRANPGPIPTYGATVPQANPSGAPGAGVLQSFLQNWKPATSGNSSGFQQGFAQALKNQGYG